MYTVEVNGHQFKVEADSGRLSVDGKPVHVDMLEFRKGRFHIVRDNRSYTAEVVSVNLEEKTFVIGVNNNLYTLKVRDKYDDLLREMGIDVSTSKKVNDMKAPMPGLVLNVMVCENQSVSKGDAILVLEALKMENIIKAPADGVVKRVAVTKGDKVEKNQVMVVMG
ncbi:MAG: biotin/lipoyl-containing protein [Bacteroidota bacterium]